MDLMKSHLSEFETWSRNALEENRSTIQHRIESLYDEAETDERRPSSTCAPSPPFDREAVVNEVRNMFSVLRPGP